MGVIMTMSFLLLYVQGVVSKHRVGVMFINCRKALIKHYWRSKYFFTSSETLFMVGEATQLPYLWP